MFSSITVPFLVPHFPGGQNNVNILAPLSPLITCDVEMMYMAALQNGVSQFFPKQAFQKLLRNI